MSLFDVSPRAGDSALRAHLAAIVESSDDAIISKNLEGIIQSCNPATERIFGYRPSELIGRPIIMLIPAERRSDEEEILGRIRRGERVDHYETVRVAKDGRRLDISLTISPIRDESGAIVGASKIARDITEMKRAAAALAAEREWFRVTLASIGDAVIASDPEGRVTYMNEIAEQLTGWISKEAQGRPLVEVFEIVNEETKKRVENPAELVLRHGKVVGLANHTALICRDGSERPIADSAAPILDDAGRIIGVVLVFRDVSEARRAEEALAEQREWFETTLESIGDAVIATDIRGQVVFMNPVAEHLTGCRSESARGRPCSEIFNIVNEKTRQLVESPVTRVLAEGTVVGLANHTVLIAADGTERPIDDSGAPIRNRDGRIVGVALVFRDVTERRGYEIERETAALQRERLLESERLARGEAERANRVKDEFVAIVSHELRTPLNAIYGWTDLIARSPGEKAVVNRGIEIIAPNVRLQSRLISDLLDVSRMISGKLRLEFQMVDLAAVVEDAVETIRPEAEAKAIRIKRGIDSSERIVGDPARLQQVVSNLLSNAIKFTPSGGQIAVLLEQRDGHTELTVEDTGMGIEPHVLPHVFDRFRQADESTKRSRSGLGLGLSIVKHLVELHGGRVIAQSDGKDKGARFTISLSNSLTHADRPAISTSPKAMATESVSLKGIRVLVVEDEPDTGDFVKQLLEAHDAEVSLARSASEALRLFAEDRPDVLVSDIGLPEMDGFELIQQIRQRDGGGGVLAVALTAFARAEDRMRALRAGYQAHLAKPVEPAELLAMISSFAEVISLHRK